MANIIHIGLYKAGDHYAPVSSPESAQVVLVGRTNTVTYGKNSFFWKNESVVVEEIHLIDGRKLTNFPAFSYEFRFFSKQQRAASKASALAIQTLLDQNDITVDFDIPALVPAVLALDSDGQMSLYHYMQQGMAGACFVNFHHQPILKNAEASVMNFNTALLNGWPKLRQAWPLFNDDCWYTKWNADIELERKFTFDGIPDTWQLINALYEEILAGKLFGFVPELDREFQVFDYESHIFQIEGENEERGYISFIPQADGKMTVKRKWFTENAEIRREVVEGNVSLDFDSIEMHVRSMTSAPYTRMPPFRRVRFDVNFESVDSGNIYGVYFDICRTVNPETSFSQCEVEYCRSRTFNKLDNVIEEFEVVADYTRHFLQRMHVGFKHDLYSKLDFVREAATQQ